MATPILRIPVDDAAFKKFLETFNKYQSALGKQEDAWADINDALVQMTENMEQQKEAAAGLTEEENRRAEALKKIAEEQRDADKEQEARDKEASKRRQHAINQVREYARGVASAAMSLTKWVSIDSALAFGGSMLSMYGLDRFANYAGDARRQASGMGISIGQMQRTSVAMSPYFNAEQTIDRIANMAGDPTQMAPLLMMGLNPRGKDPAELTLQAASRARSMFIKNKGNLAISEAQGLTQLFSPEELRRMAHESNADFSADQRLARNAAVNKGLDDKTARKWQQFTMTLDNAGYSLKNQLIDKLTTLVGPLTKLEGAFVHLVEQVLTKSNLDGIASGIESFAKWINSPDFQKGFQTFTDDVVAIASKIDSALKLLGWVPDSDPVAAAAAAQRRDMVAGAAGGAAIGGAVGGPVGAVIGGGLGLVGGFVAGSGRPLAPLEIRSNDRYQSIGRQLMGMGYGDAATKGILANLLGEGSDLNPFAWGDKDKNGNYTAYGIAQWHKDRRDEYLKHFHHTMESVRDPNQALKEQVEFIHYELKHKYKNVGEVLRYAQNPYGAAYTVATSYEKPRDLFGEAQRRGIAAQRAPDIKIHVRNQTGHSVAVTANSAAGG
jgi:hypothetical protein